MMKKFTSIAILLLSGYALQAQENYFYLTWDINIPVSSTDWISGTSTAGGKAGYRAFLNNEKFSVGLDLNWATLDQYQPKQTFPTENGALTTDYFNYIYTYGITATGQYNFTVGDGDRFYPYVGIGLGANMNEYKMYYNIYTEEDKNWGFLARPEAGILVRVGRSFGLMAAVHFDYSTNKSDYFDYKNFSTVGFQLGIALMGD
ncbi:MAG TPA: outer membrane beta-barrel protein [Ohtaekwangia sp.]|nr:outer membrane beta-barrel protein [Ohtaekwangia sp.]